MAFSITRAELESSPAELLSAGRNRTKGKVRLYDRDGLRFVVKDFRTTHPFFRFVLARWMVRHEDSVYRDLHGVRGVPGSLGRIDALAFAREFIDGRPLQTFRPGEVPAGTFRGLESIVRLLHRRGIAHGDLHHRDVILTREGEPFVIDFSSALRRGGGWNPLRKWLFRQYCRMDLRSVYKLKSRFLPGPLPPEEEEYLRHAPVLHRVGKWIRRLYRPENRPTGPVPPA